VPVIPKAPTNLTVIAVAERAADLLRSKAGTVR
jgi:choline dehydrogenase-like flavoprotein